MDTRTRSALTALGIAAFGALAVASQTRRSTAVTVDASTTSVASASASASTKTPPAAEDVPDPTADYTSLDDAKADGPKAFGKTLFIRAWRANTDATTTTLFTCGKLGTGSFLTTTYAADKRALMKAIPPSIPSQGRCPRVVIKITGKDGFTGDLKGELQQILDVTPAEPEKLPPGVDYVSLDDVNIDGKKATGKIAQLKMYRSTPEEKKFTGYTCLKAGGINFLYVGFTPEQKDAVKDLSESSLACQTVKVKLTSQTSYSSVWNATLIEVLKD